LKSKNEIQAKLRISLRQRIFVKLVNQNEWNMIWNWNWKVNQCHEYVNW